MLDVELVEVDHWEAEEILAGTIAQEHSTGCVEKRV
jgi:hypothetical protein